MTDQPSAFWDDLNRELEDPGVRADFEANQAMLRAMQCTVTATGPGGEPAEVTFGPAGGAIAYSEYRTGPSPWRKRAWRKIRRRA